MKKIILTLLVGFAYVVSFSQTDSTTRKVYCELVGSPSFGKTTVVIDMGESKGFLGLNTSYIIDESTGKPKKFNSLIDALNFMDEKGWNFEQAYVVAIPNMLVYHYLISQTISKGKDGQYYPITSKKYDRR
jgi:hypothetical protein